MFLRSCCIVWVLLPCIASAAVFMEKRQADAVLQRWRRANSGFLEEMQKGNLERECIEEKCDYEEAREVFEDDELTRRFWLRYESRDPCLENPCHNSGSCVHMGTTYQCICPDGFLGQYCDRMVEDTLGCLYHNGGCQQFCDDSGNTHRCFCADGYKLGPDGRGCIAQVQYPCGRVAPKEVSMNQSITGQTRLVGANHCPKGNCPWQVLVQLNGMNHCGGVLINSNWVITAAHCLHGRKSGSNITVVAGEHNLDVEEGTEERMPVSTAISHDGYDPATGDNDIALLRLNHSVTLNHNIIPVCLPTRVLAERELQQVRYHTVSGWGRRTVGGNVQLGSPYTRDPSPILRIFSVPIIQNSLCSQKSRFNFTDNMLCAGYLEGYQQSCRGDDGSPLVTLLGNTHFLTGVVAWGRGCSTPGYYGVYTNIANYLDWAEGIITSSGTGKAAAVMVAEMPEQKRV